MLLIVFGNLSSSTGTEFGGARILASLFSAGFWLTARLPLRLKLPIDALFYQSAVGVVAQARVVALRSTKSLKASPLPGLPIGMYPHVLDLEATHVFPKPIVVRNIAADLSFITNKVYWGHAFRYTPRLISRRDYNLIVSAGDGTT